MPPVAKELAPLVVSRLKTPGHHAVGGVAGLYLYVNGGGARSWVLRTMIGQKRRHIGLGGFPDVPLAAAKEKARQLRLEIEQGRDPIESKRAAKSQLAKSQSAALTFRQIGRAHV